MPSTNSWKEQPALVIQVDEDTIARDAPERGLLGEGVVTSLSNGKQITSVWEEVKAPGPAHVNIAVLTEST